MPLRASPGHYTYIFSESAAAAAAPPTDLCLIPLCHNRTAPSGRASERGRRAAAGCIYMELWWTVAGDFGQS